MMSEWEPIQSAPRDGARVLLLSELGRYAIGRWDEWEPCFEGRWRDTAGEVVLNPTHWKPLPEDEKMNDKDDGESEAWTLLDEWGKRPDGLHDLDLVDVRILWDDIGQPVNVRHGVFTDHMLASEPWPERAFAYRVVHRHRLWIEVGDMVKLDPPGSAALRYEVLALDVCWAWLGCASNRPFTVLKSRLRVVGRRNGDNG